MPGLSKPWVPMIGDRVRIRPSSARDTTDPANRHRGKRGTVLEYQPGGARNVEQYAVLADGDRVPIYFSADELDPFTE